MFNPERILGSLLQTGLGGSRSMGGAKVAIGLGLLGVAMEAIEHFSAQQQPQQPPPGQTPAMGSSSIASPPPPPPMPGPGPVPPAMPQTASASGPSSAEATLLIHTMIAAAYADGQFDEDEKGRILAKISGTQVTEEDRQFLAQALSSPKSLDEILSQVNTPVLAQQVYTVSLMAIHVDTEAERNYLRSLSRRLYLGDAVVARIHHELGCPQV